MTVDEMKWKWCIRYVKGTNLKANHNSQVSAAWPELGVSDMSKVYKNLEYRGLRRIFVMQI